MDSDEDFEPRLGRIRSGKGRSRSYLQRILAAAAFAGGPRRGRRTFSGARIGRGAAAGRLLSSRDRFAAFRSRRAIVKARLVRLSGGGLGAARAHLRYIQRDGGGHGGGAGGLYCEATDEADGRAFLERCSGDRHQFRFIVSAEDGSEYEDLRPLIRRAMARMEKDLQTKLDWVAVDHRDTAHPHTHVIVRGKDDIGGNLVIARDYIARGFRERVADIVSLDLGPRTDLEIRRRLLRDVSEERLTGIDRRLIHERDSAGTVGLGGRDAFDQALRAGRLRKLERLGLAAGTSAGRWRIAADLEERLRELGARGDILRTMQKSLGALDRPAVDQCVHAAGLASAAPIIGRVIGRGLADEARDQHYLIVDGVDGKAHYLNIGGAAATEPLAEGAIVRLSARDVSVRPADHIIARVAAANGGFYSEALHRAADPEADPEFLRAHVRRLEAIRKAAGGPERLPDGRWRISERHLDQAQNYEQRKVRHSPLRVETLSAVPLDALIDGQGAGWLDRELLADRPVALRDSGFGAEVRVAKANRQRWLVEQGFAAEEAGEVRYRRGLLTLLRQRELAAVGAQLSAEFKLPARTAEEGERVGGTLRRRLDLASGRFALLERSGELVLVPWRPVLDRSLGREVSGFIRRDGSASWTLGKDRGLTLD